MELWNGEINGKGSRDNNPTSYKADNSEIYSLKYYY